MASFTCTKLEDAGVVNLQVAQKIQVEDVISIVQEAGQAIMEVYGKDKDEWKVESKADESPVTAADKAANTIICQRLAQIAPHVPIVSEENKSIPHSIRQGYEFCWLVDPLDGTKEFIYQSGDFTVNIALLRQSQVILGVVGVPVTGVIYYAVAGCGAFKRQSGVDTRLTAAPYDPSAPNMVVVASARHMSNETQQFVSQLKDPQFTQLGSSLKLLLVAEGKAHVYPRLAPTCEWDTGAAHVVVSEAGGTVKQAGKCDNKGKALEDWKEALARDEEVVYNKPDPLNPFFVVYGSRS